MPPFSRDTPLVINNRVSLDNDCCCSNRYIFQWLLFKQNKTQGDGSTTQGDGSIVLTNLSEYDILSVGVRKCLDNQDKRAKAEYII